MSGALLETFRHNDWATKQLAAREGTNDFDTLDARVDDLTQA